MPLVQRPAVVLPHQRPDLPRQAPLHGVLLDVPNHPPHIFRMIQEDFPASASPDGVTGRPDSYRRQPLAAYVPEPAQSSLPPNPDASESPDTDGLALSHRRSTY